MQIQAKSTWRPFPPMLAREDCALCQGTGWQIEAAAGTSRARRCSCRILHQIVRIKEKVRIPQRYEHCTLDCYHPMTFSQSRALAEAQRFAERFPRVERGLFFVGGPGVGKTHLAVGILLELLKQFHDDILFVDFTGFRSAGWRRSNSARGMGPDLSQMQMASLLVLDDISPWSSSLGAAQEAEEMLLARIRACKTTILTADRPEMKRDWRRMSPRDDAPGHGWLSAIPAGLSMALIGHFKILMLSGEDFRRRHCSLTPLF